VSPFSYDTSLAALPFRCFTIDQDLIIKRGRVELKISGLGAVDVLLPVVRSLSAGPTTLRELCSDNPSAELIEEFVTQLISRRLISIDKDYVPLSTTEVESPSVVFSWEIDANNKSKRFSTAGLIVVGVNAITHAAALSIMATPFAGSLIVVDDPALRSSDFTNGDGTVNVNWHAPRPLSLIELESSKFKASFLLAASEVGRESDLLYWNRYCLRRKLSFLPISLRDWIGTIGPLTFPGETACLQCARSRQESNDDVLDRRFELAEEFPGVIGAHPSMAPVLGHLASIEIFKARMSLPGTRYGQVLEVNLMGSRVIPRRVLKLPRCRDCGPTSMSPSVATEVSSYADIP
jgi:molybdopterin-synthase adenylyltransferase